MFSSNSARMFHYIIKNIKYLFSLQIKAENIQIDSCDKKIKRQKGDVRSWRFLKWLYYYEAAVIKSNF